MSREEVAKLIRTLKEYVSLSYDSETTIAAEIGVSQEAMHGWVSGKVKPRLESLLLKGESSLARSRLQLSPRIPFRR
jgi:hypothetical protein